VIIIHDDGSETAHKKSFPADAPWVALPFESKKNQEIARKYSEGYVPCFFIVDFEGAKVVNGTETVEDLSSGAEACFTKWLAAIDG